MRRVALVLALLCAFSVRAGGQVGYSPNFVAGASDGERVWILTKTLDGVEAPLTLFVAPPGLETGSLRRVAGMGEEPEAVAATRYGLVSVFAPAEGSDVRRVREHRFAATSRARPGARGGAGTRALPPLPAGG
ncbi:MAG: hypothetical protein AAGH64_02285, partial [Planctomycetota bacterium]